MLKLYLDNCCFNRPFDDQNQLKVFLETQAKLDIQEKILLGQYHLIWSYILDYENEQNSNRMIKHEIAQWETRAVLIVETSEAVSYSLKRCVTRCLCYCCSGRLFYHHRSQTFE